jgi:hypothetical protein
MMIELLLAQSAATAVLAFFIIMLRRELYPLVATAGPVESGFWIRSADVLVLAAPQFEVSKTVIKIRWAFTEELFLRHRFRVYDVAMRPSSQVFYKKWKAWLSGDKRYDCWVEKPRGLARLYNKAIDIVCFKKEEERRPKEVIILPSRMRKRGKRIIEVY